MNPWISSIFHSFYNTETNEFSFTQYISAIQSVFSNKNLYQLSIELSFISALIDYQKNKDEFHPAKKWGDLYFSCSLEKLNELYLHTRELQLKTFVELNFPEISKETPILTEMECLKFLEKNDKSKIRTPFGARSPFGFEINKGRFFSNQIFLLENEKQIFLILEDSIRSLQSANVLTSNFVLSNEKESLKYKIKNLR